MNTLFRIAFGDYEFVLDRTNLTYSLTETVTKTIWATALSLGWIELKDRATGAVTRTDFGECKLISIAEKMGAAGKRILLGLDAPGGVPIDIYLICGSKDIQLTVEASRDSKTHLLERVGLLPGLCQASQGGHLVLPLGEGTLLYPKRYQPVADPQYEWDSLTELRVWTDLTMPFIGAVQRESALTLITDSAYAFGVVEKTTDDTASVSWIYQRDPERRRLDIRIVMFPAGDHVAIARAYREKLIGERNHRTLRKKLRDVPEKEYVIGATFIKVNTSHDQLSQISDYLDVLKEGLGLERVILSLAYNQYHEVPETLVIKAFSQIQEADYRAVLRPVNQNGEPLSPKESQKHFGGDTALSFLKWREFREADSRWDFIEQTLTELEQLQNLVPLVGVAPFTEWQAILGDFTLGTVREGRGAYRQLVDVPLYSVVYRDSVVALGGCAHFDKRFFLQSLLRLSPPQLALPTGFYDSDDELITELRPQVAILCHLHALTFPAFLTAHQFLTPDFLVEEALYSDKTRVVINQSKTETYDAGEFLLPPGGFYVRHPLFEAHDALRVGTVEFPQRAWRVRRSLDGKPLEQSEQVEEREFAV